MNVPDVQPAPHHTTVLAVGLERYDYGQPMDLRGAAAHAVRFARWTRNRGVPVSRIRLACAWLLDEDDQLAGAVKVGTTRDELGRALHEVMNEGGDLLLLYWCGHGVAADGGQSRRLYTSNATRIDKVNLPVEEIIRLLSSAHGKGFAQQVLIIDACANYVEEMAYGTGLPPGGYGSLPPRAVPQFVYYATDISQVAAYNRAQNKAEFSTAVFDWLERQPGQPFLPDMETLFAHVDAVFTKRAASGQYTQRPVALQVKPFHGIERQHTYWAGVELSPDVVEMHSPTFLSAGVPPPPQWTTGELSRIALDPSPSRLSDLVAALRRAIEAKPVMLEIGVSRLKIGRLQVIYREQVGAWPSGASVDALLVEAAEADRSQQRRGVASSLRALAKFVIGVAAALSQSPEDSPALMRWIESLGHQLADAQQHYVDRAGAPTWLLIDLGKEPGPRGTAESGSTTPTWPKSIRWTYTSQHQIANGPITGEVAAAQTKKGLAEALIGIFASLPPSWPLLVDIAMPAALLNEGIERWPLFVDDSLNTTDSLSDRYQPRLRWSQRRHDLVLHGRCMDRVRRTELGWDTIPAPMKDAVLSDELRLKQWIKENTDNAWVIGCSPLGCRSDPLRVLLKEGFGFLIWFPRGVDKSQRRAITQTVSQIPVDARRSVIPDELADMSGLPVVIWDDPRGRGEMFKLPAPFAAEYIPMLQT